MTYNPNEFESLPGQPRPVFGPIDPSEDTAFYAVEGPAVESGGTYFCNDVTRVGGSEACTPAGIPRVTDVTVDVASLPTFPGPYPRIATRPDVYVVDGATVADLVPQPPYIRVKVVWQDITFEGCHTGCYVGRLPGDDSGPVVAQGCGDSALGRPGVFIDAGGYSIDSAPLDVDLATTQGTEINPDPGSGLITVRSPDDDLFSGEPGEILVHSAPNSSPPPSAIVPGGQGYIKIADAYDLGAVGGYTGDPGNPASRYLLPYSGDFTVTFSVSTGGVGSAVNSGFLFAATIEGWWLSTEGVLVGGNLSQVVWVGWNG